MFIEWEAPEDPRPGPPRVLVHGGGGQATDYTGTPDGAQDGRGCWSSRAKRCSSSTAPATAARPITPTFSGRWARSWVTSSCAPSSSRRRRGPTATRPHTCTPSGGAGVPITYDPPVSDPGELETVTEERAVLGPVPLTLQREPARRLANLSRVPIAVVIAEASMFLLTDRHLVEFLAQGGCDVDLLRLADHGVHGNGPPMMLELNHAEALGVLTGWVAGKLDDSR
jgi:hypothetical protein